MAKDIYNDLFTYYEIRRDNEKIKNIRVQIIRQLKKEYGIRPEEWYKLSEYEKNRFKLIHMYEYLRRFSKDVVKVDKKRNKDIDESFRQLQALHKHNDFVNNLYKDYINSSMSEEEKHNAYLEFCKDLKNGFPALIPPSFDAWKDNPLRIYDYISDPYSEVDPSAVKFASVPQEDVDHEILECILKILKEKWGYVIDVAGIRQCLADIKDIDNYNNVPLVDDDNNVNMTLAEQQRIIGQQSLILESKDKLDKHDFIIGLKQNNIV